MRRWIIHSQKWNASKYLDSLWSIALLFPIYFRRHPSFWKWTLPSLTERIRIESMTGILSKWRLEVAQGGWQKKNNNKNDSLCHRTASYDMCLGLTAGVPLRNGATCAIFEANSDFSKGLWYIWLHKYSMWAQLFLKLRKNCELWCQQIRGYGQYSNHASHMKISSIVLQYDLAIIHLSILLIETRNVFLL